MSRQAAINQQALRALLQQADDISDAVLHLSRQAHLLTRSIHAMLAQAPAPPTQARPLAPPAHLPSAQTPTPNGRRAHPLTSPAFAGPPQLRAPDAQPSPAAAAAIHSATLSAPASGDGEGAGGVADGAAAPPESDDPRFAVREAPPPFNGLGLFARIALPPNQTILQYEGETLDEGEMGERYGIDGPTGEPRVPPQYVLRLECPARYIDASRTPNALARYINHADNKHANVKYTERGTVRTIKRIRPGQQLLANYGRDAVAMLRKHGLLPPPPARKRKRGEESDSSPERAAQAAPQSPCL